MAVQEVQVFRLGIESQFDSLTPKEKKYAHHMARAAWNGTKIILRQVSPESLIMFDFILELYQSCSGNWKSLIDAEINVTDVNRFVQYAATFLSNIGNYYGSGDQKFIPHLKSSTILKLSSRSPSLSIMYSKISDTINSIPPFGLGYPGKTTQSGYYPGGDITKEEIDMVSKVLEQNGVFPENTRVRKAENGNGFDVLIASQLKILDRTIFLPDSKEQIHLISGDHSVELENICTELSEAMMYAANDLQRSVVEAYIQSFRTGDLEKYRDSQRLWVKDKAPRVENIFGFVEPYRDPHGIRAEFEAIVAIADDRETKILANLVYNSEKFIRRLPWATSENSGKGPFEKSLFEAPDFSSIHSLAYCSSIIFPGINLPNYNDIRQDTGFKNVIIANRMIAEGRALQYPFIDPSEAETFKKHKYPAYYWWVVLHELLGHGTGQMMVEEAEGKFNFDIHNPPIDPITQAPIKSWYKRGQTWTGKFGDLATTVDECRAELVGAYLLDDKELLESFGFTENSDITAEDLTYNMYQQLGVDGLRGLSNFNVESGKWGQAHSRAHFAILKCLLRAGDGVISIIHNKEMNSLTVHVDRSKIITHGKPALGDMLLRLHMYRCTANAEGCRIYYEELSEVDREYLKWRDVVLWNKPPPLLFVHANTFTEGENIVLKEYEPTVEGIIQSWAERGIYLSR